MSNATDDELRLLIERIERLDEEIKGIQDDRKDVFAEAKGRGYDTKIMKDIIRYRKMKPDDQRYWDEVFETYKLAIGMGDLVDRAARNFEKATEGVPVSMSVDGGEFVPINKAAREAAAVAE